MSAVIFCCAVNDLFNGAFAVRKYRCFALESTYCLGCGACVKVCPEHALKLVEHDASNLVVVDPEAEEKAAQKAKAHEEAEKVKAEAKAKLDKMLDQVEKLAD